MNDVKEKLRSIWNQMDPLEKGLTVALSAFILLFLIAFLKRKSAAGTFAIMSAVLVVVTFLIKKNLIKVPNQRYQWMTLGCAFMFLLPYSLAIHSEEAEVLNWNEIVLKDVLPKPSSDTGTISSNTKSYLSVEIDEVTAPEYYDYVDSCKEKGFDTDADEDDLSYNAYNEKGYLLSLYYHDSDKQMDISLEKGMELDTLVWPESTLVKMIPVPDSTTGNIETDTDTSFTAYVGEISISDYSTYVNACIDQGFSEDQHQTEKTFSARNTDGYKLSVDYRGNNIIFIKIEEPQYDVSIEIQCDENMLFSQYDVEVYADEESLGTVDHGESETYSIVLKKGTHLIQFVSAEDSTVTDEVEIDIQKDEEYQFKIHCYSTSINIKTMKGTLSEAELEKEETEEPTEEPTTEAEEPAAENTPDPSEETEGNITPENNEDLAKLLTTSSADYDYFTEFSRKYRGKTIEFDASIDDFYANSKWNYDILLSAGDYNINEIYGPSFKFDGVSRMQYDTDLKYLLAGINVHIVAEVGEFDENTGLFFLDAEVINGR